ncbi:acyl-ACP--UDP-N-acetylglucosamine O-acyltransferase [Methylopila sp. 73B]|uniref:acyl-ACP--UDP-N-acetylglucosamine O-acyltransferase n=1 Tax=Methylopila sp. 73B TaxID=1120792 RepID=UPI00037B568F|nr:acyl-ACP--UDP-N-acetylglucosamine O-acyltransferase [Methylopila sp. 73B]
MPDIHPTAFVAEGARLADDVVVGAFCAIGPHVEIGAGSVLRSHVAVDGRTVIGEGAQIFPFASVGHQPQDLKYRGEPSRLVIGRNALIRENVTINPGTEGGAMVTEIGDDCALLAGAHVAHDCRIGNNVILVNNVMVAGHVMIGDFAILGGGSAAHQYVRIGAHAFLGGLAGLENDLIPFGMAIGNRAHLAGLNLVGLKRRGFERDGIHALRRAYKDLFAEAGVLKARAAEVAAAHPDDELVQEVTAFIAAGGDRAICTPRSGEARAA